MSIITNKILNSVVAIGNINSQNPNNKNWIGTGFLIGYRNDISNDNDEVYLVTNKHVVRNQQTLYIRFNMQDISKGVEDYPLQIKDINDGRYLFSLHPNNDVDIVACSLNLQFLKDKKSLFNFFDINKDVYFLNDMREKEILEGNLVYSLGFPMNLVTQNIQCPICRLGCISRISDIFSLRNPINFLVDAQTFPGNSGGPIICRPECVKNYIEPKLVGILHSYIPYKEYLYSQQTGQLRSQMEENSGLTVVHPVDRILEVIKIEQNRINLAKNR